SPLCCFHSTPTSAHATNRSPSPRRDPPIPEPETFDGNVDKCWGVLLQCRRVFDQQPQTFCTDQEKINYVINGLHEKTAISGPYSTSSSQSPPARSGGVGCNPNIQLQFQVFNFNFLFPHLLI
uniref:Uncharacterized protein n=1 Tax=Monopterus albus TaxID=43700 RepID=A0A3Q3R2N4_MONAL